MTYILRLFDWIPASAGMTRGSKYRHFDQSWNDKKIHLFVITPKENVSQIVIEFSNRLFRLSGESRKPVFSGVSELRPAPERWLKTIATQSRKPKPSLFLDVESGPALNIIQDPA